MRPLWPTWQKIFDKINSLYAAFVGFVCEKCSNARNIISLSPQPAQAERDANTTSILEIMVFSPFRMLHEIPEISIRHHCHGKPLQLGGGGGGGCWVRWGDGGMRWGAVWGMGGGGRWGIWVNADRIHLPSGCSSQNLWMRLDFIQSLSPACCLQGECEERRWQGQGFHGGTSPPRIHNRTWQSSSRPPSWPWIDIEITHWKLTESVLPPGIKPTLIPGRGTVIFLDNIKSEENVPFQITTTCNWWQFFLILLQEKTIGIKKK